MRRRGRVRGGSRGIAELILDGMMLCDKNLKLNVIDDNIITFNTQLARENKKQRFDLPGYGLFS